MIGPQLGHRGRVNTANDLGQILIIVFGTVGGIVGLLFLLAAIDPRTDKTRPAQPKSSQPSR